MVMPCVTIVKLMAETHIGAECLSIPLLMSPLLCPMILSSLTLLPSDPLLSSGKTTTMRNFKDSSLKNSKFFGDLIFAIEPRAVDYEQFSSGTDPDALMANARYVISSARKLGACVFLVPEDIVEVKSKMILTFISNIWTAELNRA